MNDKDHIDDARSRLNPCACGCDFVSIITQHTDNNLKSGELYACCGYCHKRTKTYKNPFNAQTDWNNGQVYDKHIGIADERKIIENHISMIANCIDEYNDTMQLEGDAKITLPVTPMWVIVQELLLQGANHAGMTTSRQKTKELGFDCDKNAFEQTSSDD